MTPPETQPLRRLPQQKRSRERVERILDAAAEVFASVGYEVATTHLIAERADTAVGSLYQFFPDKRAIFRALEERHLEQLYVFQAKLRAPEIARLPLERMVRHIVEMTIQFLKAPAPRVMFILYYTTPQLFDRYDDDFLHQLVTWAAGLLSTRNPALAASKAEIVAEVFIRSANHLLLVALLNEGERQQRFFLELQDLLVAYLRPYDSETSQPDQAVLPPEAKSLPNRHQLALAWVIREGELTIQMLEKLCPDQSRRSLQRDLKVLVEQGWLETVGQTSQRTYRTSTRLRSFVTSYDI